MHRPTAVVSRAVASAVHQTHRDEPTPLLTMRFCAAFSGSVPLQRCDTPPRDLSQAV